MHGRILKIGNAPKSHELDVTDKENDKAKSSPFIVSKLSGRLVDYVPMRRVPIGRGQFSACQ